MFNLGVKQYVISPFLSDLALWLKAAYVIRSSDREPIVNIENLKQTIYFLKDLTFTNVAGLLPLA